MSELTTFHADFALFPIITLGQVYDELAAAY